MKLEDFYIGQGSFRDTKAGKVEFNIRFIDENGDKKSKSFTADTEDDCRMQEKTQTRKQDKQR